MELPSKIQFRPAHLEENLKKRMKPGSPNQQVREMVERYMWVMEESLPEVSEKELRLITDVTNGTYISRPEGAKMLWAEIAEAEERYFEKWEVDREELVEKARGWTAAECSAVLDWVDQFWAENAE
jgi:hypothetical protein